MRRMSSRRRPESNVKHKRLCEEDEAKREWSTRTTADKETQEPKVKLQSSMISTERKLNLTPKLNNSNLTNPKTEFFNLPINIWEASTLPTRLLYIFKPSKQFNLISFRKMRCNSFRREDKQKMYNKNLLDDRNMAC